MVVVRCEPMDKTKTEKTADIFITWLHLIREMQTDGKIDAATADKLIDAAFATCVDIMDWVDERIEKNVQRS